MLVHIHIHVRFQVHLQSAGQPASQLGSQPGQSTFSIDVARLRTHIADSWTKQSPVSNSVRHSLTESCLPFISICQSGQQAAGCGSKNSSSSCQLEFLYCPLLLPPLLRLRTQFSLLFIVYCFLCAVLFATLCARGRGAVRGREFGNGGGIGIFSMLARARTLWGHSNRYGFNSFLAYFHFKFIFS